MLLMSPSLFLLQCPAYFVDIGWIVRMEVSDSIAAVLWSAASRIYSKQHVAFSCSFHLAFSQCGIHVVHLYNSTNSARVCKELCFILAKKPDFHRINNLSIVVHTFARHMLTLLSVNEIVLPRYMSSFLFETQELYFICIHIEANVSCSTF